jgi:hypothetical protein
MAKKVVSDTDRGSDASAANPQTPAARRPPTDLLRLQLMYDESGELPRATRDTTIAELGKIFRNPISRERILGKAESDAAVPPSATGVAVSRDLCSLLIVSIVRAERLIAKLAGARADRADALDITQEQLDAIVPAAQTVLALHSVSLGKYEPYIALGASLVPVVATHAAILRGQLDEVLPSKAFPNKGAA